MNSVYGLRQEDAFQALVQVDDEGEIAYDASVAIRATALCGREFGSNFEPVKLSWGTPRRNKTSDIQTMLSPFLVFSAKAFDALAFLLEGSGQLLPVETPVEGMRGFHVTRVLEDAVDMKASKFKIYPQATVFNKIVLMVDRVRNVSIFRLKESPAAVFVSDQFKHAVQANKLKGFDFGDAIALSSKSSSQP
ncbi:imm11 family protein [Burkholderia pseudomallei]